MNLLTMTDKLLSRYRGRKFEVEYWDGTRKVYGTEDSNRLFTI